VVGLAGAAVEAVARHADAVEQCDDPLLLGRLCQRLVAKHDVELPDGRRHLPHRGTDLVFRDVTEVGRIRDLANSPADVGAATRDGAEENRDRGGDEA